MTIEQKKMKLINSYELHKDLKTDAARKIASSATRDAIEAAKRKKTYILIYTEK
jgi:hypothetical protein